MSLSRVNVRTAFVPVYEKFFAAVTETEIGMVSSAVRHTVYPDHND